MAHRQPHSPNPRGDLRRGGRGDRNRIRQTGAHFLDGDIEIVLQATLDLGVELLQRRREFDGRDARSGQEGAGGIRDGEELEAGGQENGDEGEGAE